MNPFDLPGPTFLALWFGGAGVAWIVTAIVRFAMTSKRWTRPTIDELTSRMHPTEIAYLEGGIERAIESAVTGLHHRGLIEINGSNLAYVERPVLLPDGTYRGVVAHEELSAVERFVIERKTIRVSELVGDADSLDRSLASKLTADHLLVADRVAVRVTAMLPAVAWILFGAAKVFVGIARDRPVSTLLLGMAVFAFIAFSTAKARRRTGKGDALLRRLRRRLRALETTAQRAPQQLSGADMMLAYGVFGSALLGASALAQLMPSYHRQLLGDSVSTGGCGSSCSSCGGGCGGGCGGCS